MSNDNWDDNIATVALAVVGLVKEFKILVTFLALGAAFTLGWLNVPVFEAIVDGLVRIAQAAIPGIGPS